MSRNGIFSYLLKKEYQSLVIEVKSNGYLLQSITVENPTFEILCFNFILEKDTNIVLKEVLIVAKKKTV
jgi:hypothetical protein